MSYPNPQPPPPPQATQQPPPPPHLSSHPQYTPTLPDPSPTPPPPPPPPKPQTHTGSPAPYTSPPPPTPRRPPHESQWAPVPAADQSEHAPETMWGPQERLARGEMVGWEAGQQEQHSGTATPGLGAPAHMQYPPLQEGWVPQVLLDKGKNDLLSLLHSPALLTALLNDPSTAPPALAVSAAPNTPQAHLAHLLALNAQLAAHAKALAEQLATQRAETSAHLLAVRGLETQYRRKVRAVEEAVAPWAPRSLYQGLGVGIAEAEARARAIEEGFLDGQGVAGEREVTDWVRRVREARGVVALRTERRARWDEGRVGGWR